MPESGAGAVAALEVVDTDAMVALGRRVAALLRAGDVLVLTGGLGAGKTTFTRGLGEGLGVRGAVTSPTFVLSRVHPPLGDGPGLVHVDAYRLGGASDGGDSGSAQLDDLDLDATLEESVTVVEWGEGLAEVLAADRLEIRIDRSEDPDDEARHVTLTGVGDRWSGAALPGR